MKARILVFGIFAVLMASSLFSGCGDRQRRGLSRTQNVVVDQLIADLFSGDLQNKLVKINDTQFAKIEYASVLTQGQFRECVLRRMKDISSELGNLQERTYLSAYFATSSPTPNGIKDESDFWIRNSMLSGVAVRINSLDYTDYQENVRSIQYRIVDGICE